MKAWVWLALILVGACAPSVPTVRSQIEVFHQLNPADRGRTVAVVPADPAKRGSLEFQTFADRVGAYLAGFGFRVVDETAKPELRALFDYSVDNGRQVSTTHSVPDYGITGYIRRGGHDHHHDDDDDNDDDDDDGHHHHGHGVLVPVRGIVGYHDVVTVETVFTRRVDLAIVDAGLSVPGRPSMLYEAHLVSEGGCGQLVPVMDELIGSLFTDFPGTSGTARTVTVQSRYRC